MAHWCDCLWDSRYNIVVRPVIDSIDVPEVGSATLDVWIQNNMGYPLNNFVVVALASGFNVSVSVDESTRSKTGHLLAGERLRHTLWIERAGGGTSLDINQVSFYVAFGGGVQDDRYGSQQPTTPSRDAIVRRQDGALYPASPTLASDNNSSQARHLLSAARADFAANAGDRSSALGTLFAELCAGRDSWGSGDPGAPITTYCPAPDGVPDTTCPPTTNRGTGTTKWDWQHLWAAGELAYRWSALSTVQRGALRDRLYCAQNDEVRGMKAFALVALAITGNGSFTSDVSAAAGATVQDFLTTLAASGGGTTPEARMGKAGLFMLGGGNEAEVRDCLSSGDPFAEIVCAAALSVRGVDGNDAAMTAEVFPRISWSQPEDQSPAGLGFFASHVANLVAWHKRSWAAAGGESGTVSFYKEENVAPRAPVNVRCDATQTLAWDAVAHGVNNQPEPFSVGYRVRWGSSAGNPVHTSYTVDTAFTAPDLTPGSTYYFSVIAVDDSLNASSPSVEVGCVAGGGVSHPPVAAISCAPTSGVRPLSGNCNCDGSTDPDGNINHCYFRIDGGSEVDGRGTGFPWSFATAGTRVISVRVTDTTGLSDTAQVNIRVDDPANQAPTARATATPTSGNAPLTVNFTGSTSSDPDGSIAGYTWDFDDGGSSTATNPSHTFAAAGTYDVTLTVRDNGSPALTGTAGVRITVSEPVDPPVAVLACAPTSGLRPLHVVCDCDGSSDPNDNIDHCYFRVGSGTEVDGLTGGVSYDFATAGTRTITLRVTDTTGLSDTAQRTIRVDDPTNQAPTAVATADLVAGDVPLFVQFSGSTSADPDGAVVDWFWDFGDGETSTLDEPAHEFVAAGTYDVTLTVTDDGSPPLTGVATVQISVTNAANVNRPPSCDAALVTPAEGVAPMTVALDGRGCNDPDGDGLTLTWAIASVWTAQVELDGDLAEHTFTRADEYTVTLAASDDGVPPRQISRVFTVRVSESETVDTDLAPLVAVGYACAAQPGSGVVPLALALLGVALRRRRRPRR